MNRTLILIAGLALTLGLTAIWYGPVGTAERMERGIETAARAELDRLEMTFVEAGLDQSPLTRTLRLSGPADDFQRSELPAHLQTIPGVAAVRWNNGGFALPLIAEAWLLSLAGFLLGLMLAYLFELRRRATADRRW